jgi:hypothetical protein
VPAVICLLGRADLLGGLGDGLALRDQDLGLAELGDDLLGVACFLAMDLRSGMKARPP